MATPAPKDPSIFRILVVDDDPIAVYLIRQVMKNFQRDYQLDAVSDGVETLDFLHRRGAHGNASRPNLILLDLHMPRLGGLETLSAIKTDPDLCVIPVIMLSSANSADDVRNSYLFHANCYVQKPADLERSVKLIQAVEAFWMDFALQPSQDERTLANRQVIDAKITNSTVHSLRAGPARFGSTIAPDSSEEGSQPVGFDGSPIKPTATRSDSHGCEEHKRLLDEFGGTVQEVLRLHEQQFQAIVEGDSESYRFDVLIHMANEKKQLAKYAYLRHVETHGCSSN
jgi:two-component system, chemotaxis family, response regulator Rcp1